MGLRASCLEIRGVIGSVNVISGLQKRILSATWSPKLGRLALTRPQASGKWFMLHNGMSDTTGIRLL